jgi:O-antigen/teichoic acid export membrane protein
VTGNAVLIPLFGLLGAALAQIITASVVLFVTNHISQRYLTVGYEYKRTAIIVGVTVLFFVLSLPLMTMPMYVGIPAKLLLYVIFAATMIFSGALDRFEIGWLRSTVKRSVGR